DTACHRFLRPHTFVKLLKIRFLASLSREASDYTQVAGRRQDFLRATRLIGKAQDFLPGPPHGVAAANLHRPSHAKLMPHLPLPFGFRQAQ
ncbi:hypothetical protein, partial [Rivihabitans pingtungensis]|uniref:hypothetical protein n=1 Tax=Rivihabitans pingtungensis TaxID=1054498 RepID=UPI0023F32050